MQAAARGTPRSPGVNDALPTDSCGGACRGRTDEGGVRLVAATFGGGGGSQRIDGAAEGSGEGSLEVVVGVTVEDRIDGAVGVGEDCQQLKEVDLPGGQRSVQVDDEMHLQQYQQQYFD